MYVGIMMTTRMACLCRVSEARAVLSRIAAEAHCEKRSEALREVRKLNNVSVHW